MPVSHLGLTVSHIPSATSFYLSALHPLGYRFIGSRGDSIGLGVHEADFFLTQEPNGYRLAPTHIAFAARTSAAVRQCYASALAAGGMGSGRPSYREDDCKCFNAAVEDLDGNTVEFIWRDNSLDDHEEPLDYGRLRPGIRRAQTSRAAESPTRSPPGAGLKRASTEPVDSMSSKALLGVVFGAAAGAAVGYAMRSGGRESRYDDRDHDVERHRQRRSTSAAGGEKYRHSSGRYPPDPRRVIESKSYRDDDDFAYTRTRVTRQSQGQTRAVEAIEYNPSKYTARRSATLPLETASRTESKRESRSRRDSVVSGTASKTPKHSSARVKSSTSQASTVKPAKKTIYYVTTPSQVPLPESVASKSTASRRSKKSFDAYYLPDDEDSDGLGDTATIVPDDSISCVGTPRRRSDSRRGDRADKPNSVMTLPIRAVRDERPRGRTSYSHA